MTQLSKYFTLEEAIFSSTAIRLGIVNQPDSSTIMNIWESAQQMDKVRALLGFPVHVDSWLRVPLLNEAVGGAIDSAHISGFAIDFICPQFGTPQQIAQAIISSDIQFDMLILEGNWCHISFSPQMRRATLTAHFSAGQPTTYKIGINVVPQ